MILLLLIFRGTPCSGSYGPPLIYFIFLQELTRVCVWRERRTDGGKQNNSLCSVGKKIWGDPFASGSNGYVRTSLLLTGDIESINLEMLHIFLTFFQVILLRKLHNTFRSWSGGPLKATTRSMIDERRLPHGTTQCVQSGIRPHLLCKAVLYKTLGGGSIHEPCPQLSQRQR